MTMIDEKFALLRTHRNNIARYRRLLKTKLTEYERQFIERRLSGERSAMEKLAASWPRNACSNVLGILKLMRPPADAVQTHQSISGRFRNGAEFRDGSIASL